MKVKIALLATGAAGALALGGVGVAYAATAPVAGAQSPVTSSTANPDGTSPEPAGETADGPDGPGGHADPAGDVDHQGGPQEQ